mmetsp:Transcript_5996/g.10521  ORF Transcript_5996/g.10521 Transcript_5996/m.10521 type:complete len:133 (-) Transcript_5996:319-717(-)
MMIRNWFTTIFLVTSLLVAAEVRPSLAFVTSPSVIDLSRTRPNLNKKTKILDPFSHHTCRPLYVSLLAQNETTAISSSPSLDDSNSVEEVTINTIFPVPPPPPTDEELHIHGLPILVEAAKHVKAVRIMNVS